MQGTIEATTKMKEKKQERSEFARWSFKHACISATLAALAVLGFRFGIMNYQVAVVIIIGAAALGVIAVLSAIVSILAIITAVETKVTGAPMAITGLILGLAVVTPVFQTIQAGYKVPRIHDITTDLQNPPAFTAIAAIRTTDHNPLDRKTPARLAELQQAGYPGLGPILIDKDPARVFENAVSLVEERGWEIVAATAGKGIIEATATTRIMGFKDDVVIRISAKEGQSIVDMRSASRIGISDMGTNAARIRLFLNDLNNT
ncbi:Protein of unknown function [Nitrosomonas sp. Nm51]|uniref:DUF1499 domain-containing protein n=1 Tax=Nitrosomonas sp. Nm51 TaxID=133720 RepID=UPI0008C37A73|nr:DUF1499 domain-containing protein [Nitrosomonas sp. Nm51]SER51504.1 Protein of unknown function [Nitrosomonas sp. Nm51]